MARTRRRLSAEQLSQLSREPDVLAHIFAAMKDDYGVEGLEELEAVCTDWQVAVRRAMHLGREPDYAFGELRSGDKPLRFDRPHGALFLPDGDICVADCDNFRLQMVTRDGFYSREIKLSGGTSCPTGVASDGPFLYVVEHGAHCLSKLSASSEEPSPGIRLATAGRWGGGPGELRHPWGIAVAHDVVYVSDGGNDRICTFSANTLQYLHSFGSGGSRASQLREPRGLAIAGDELLVADSANHRIQVFTLGGEFVRTIGGGESASLGRFKQPSGLAVTGDLLYVSEASGGRVQVMSLAGRPMQAVAFGAPCSGLCVDEEYLCVTALEGGSAVNLLAIN